jgi:hypothetical protein
MYFSAAEPFEYAQIDLLMILNYFLSTLYREIAKLDKLKTY